MTIMSCCCFFTSLRTASYATVFYTLIYFSISCVTICTDLYDECTYRREDLEKPFVEEHIFNDGNMSTSTVIFNILLLACASFGVVSSLLVVIGLRKDKRELLFPWIIVMLTDTFFEVGHFAYLIIFNKFTFVPVTAILFTIEFFIMCLNIYCVLCVVSQYQEYQAGRGCAVPDGTFSCTVEALHYSSPGVDNNPQRTRSSLLSNALETKQKLTPMSTNYIQTNDKNLHSDPYQLNCNSSKKRVQFPD